MKLSEPTRIFLRTLPITMLLLHGCFYAIASTAHLDFTAYFSAENYAQVGRGFLTVIAIIWASIPALQKCEENANRRTQ